MAAAICRAIAVGGSAGAPAVLSRLLAGLPGDFALPVLVCQHLHPSDGGYFAQHLGEQTAVAVVEAGDKMPLLAGRVHVAPANYHLLVERDGTLALSIDPKVRWSRPSIDVLFESAAYVFNTGLLGILLSGASHDGAAGLEAIQRLGGLTVAQSPASAGCPVMPQAAIDRGAARCVLAPEEIVALVLRLHRRPDLEPAAGGGEGSPR